ncbi:DeoR/GlpR family DNA-binding transcription regulator [Tabrizicola aquatica]|uniref:DeoR/GlpR family DNA-binding transcription regulator n=1 Tax=Tabrizicola aquatica TaxID=909926 RepID=UPI000CD0402B|nr:DeoR/GlpR family DNA-binding transcription regulator [Tabrizicola aquatica]
MKPHERQPQIEAIIRREGEASVELLAQRFDVSPETIRRDLGQLAERGRVQKVHGGARRPRLIQEPSHTQRETTATEAKAAIGHRLASALEAGETVFVDTGSTTLAAAESLASVPNLTIITNSCRLAERIARVGTDATIHLLGGRYGADNAQTTGTAVVEQLQSFRADRAILTVAALDPDLGAMDASLDEAQIARAMVRHARTLTVLADATKFGRQAAYAVCGIEEIDLIISDDNLDKAHREALRDKGVELWT